MFTVYVLFSKKFKRIYIGFTSYLQKRFLSHNELATKGHTVKFRPWIIAYTEVFNTKSEAMAREKQLKADKGREWIWNEVIPGLLSASG